MLACRRANTAARPTVGTTLAEDASARAIQATGVRACSHAVVRARRQTSTVGAGEGTAVRGPIPATAGTQACSGRRANTAARQLSRHGTGGGRQCEVAIPAVVGMRAAFGYGVGKGRGP